MPNSLKNWAFCYIINSHNPHEILTLFGQLGAQSLFSVDNITNV